MAKLYSDSFMSDDSMQNPDNSDYPDMSENPSGPNEQKKQCRDSGGIWIGTGPYGQGYCQAQASQPNKDCGEGYTWEPDPNGNPNGRCVVTGTKWEDACFIDPDDGKTYCKNSPKPTKTSDSIINSNSSTSSKSSSTVNPNQGQYEDLWTRYNKLFNNSDVADPYDAAAIARLEGKLKGNAEASKSANRKQYLASRSAMGLGTTGRTEQGLRNINDTANAKIDAGVIDINDTAIRANYDNAVANVNRQITLLGQQAQFALSMAGDSNQRQSIQNSYAIQMMQLQNQMEMLKLQLTAQLAG